MTTETIRLRVFASTEDDSADDFLASLREAGLEPRTVYARGSAPLGEMLITATAGAHAVVYVINSLRRTLRRGVVIDALDQQLVIRADPSLSRGMVIIRSQDGEVTFRDGEGIPESLLSAVTNRSTADGQGERPGSAGVN